MKVLVVDDDKEICNLISKVIKKEGYSVRTTNNGHDAIRFTAEEDPAVVFLDIKMPGLDGIEVLKEIKKINSDTVVVMITGYTFMRFAVETMKFGAYDFLTKPVKLNDIRVILKEAKDNQETQKIFVSLVSPELRKESRLDLINGHSPKMLKAYKMIGMVTDAKSAVLITGESGTGKELVAKAIHFNGSRKNKPFVAIDCASLPPTLLESELFGHEKGSFTGAISRKRGKFEAANEGTIFLDEIANLTMDTQVKLLRTLQEKEIVRVGGSKPVKVDVRIIAATNQDLVKTMQEGKFKPDLYYRLNIISIHIPPLRERKEDIPILVDHFIEKTSKGTRFDKAKSISKEALDLLIRYDWPGNVRELENIVERAIVIGRNRIIWPEDLPREILEYSEQKEKDLNEMNTSFQVDAIKRGIGFNEAKGEFEKALTQVSIKKANGNLQKVAENLKISLRSLRYMVKKYGLKDEIKEARRVAKEQVLLLIPRNS